MTSMKGQWFPFFSVRFAAAAAILLAVGVLGGCSRQSGPPIRTHIEPYTREQQLVRETAREARYRLRKGDIIKIAFKYEKELDQKTVLIHPDGYISPEGIEGSVKALGMTVDELDKILTAGYAKDYRNPDLTVVLLEVTEPEVYVLGMVYRPGLYKMPMAGTGVIQAIASAGGFKEDAAVSETVLMRATETGFMIRSLDLAHLERTGFQGAEVFDLQPYDVIFVPRSSLGDFKYLTEAVFGSAINISQFFWDIYALANLDKVSNILR